MYVYTKARIYNRLIEVNGCKWWGIYVTESWITTAHTASNFDNKLTTSQGS